MRLHTGLLTILSFALALPPAVRADTFPPRTDTPKGISLVIDGSSSLATVNQSLKQAFELQYPDKKIDIRYGGTDRALQALDKGTIDIAAIGRPLTEAEKSRGFRTIPLPRRKIAIVVSPENPFGGSLSDRQFAAIFRGEITDWSELGREAGPIRVIDRYRGDTRRAFVTYGAFPTDLTTGMNTVRLEEDSTLALTRELGRDGIGYTIDDQAINNPNLRVVSMFDTPVTDPRYPFSQPRYLVYKDVTNPAVRSFITFVTSPTGKTAIENASPISETILRAGATVASPTAPESPTDSESPTAPESPTDSESPTAPESPTDSEFPGVAESPATTATDRFPRWWLGLLLPLILLGGFESWWRNRRSEREIPPDIPPPIAGDKPVASLPPAAIAPEESELIVTSSVIPPVEFDTSAVTPPVEFDAVGDFLESLIDSELDTEAMLVERETPEGRTFAPPDLPGRVTEARELTTDEQNTALDLLLFSDEEEETDTPSGFPSGVVPLAALSAPGVSAPTEMSGSSARERESDPISRFSPAPVVPNRDVLEVDARSHCYKLGDLHLLHWDSRSNSIYLNPGLYWIKIAGGVFRYSADGNFAEGEPVVLLWIFGGRFINRQTKVETEQTWVSLNGYEDKLILQVLESTRLCALFFDTGAGENQGQIELSIKRSRKNSTNR